MKTANTESFIRNFINIYRRNSALWKVKSKSYTDRKLKERGYNELLRLFKTVDANASIDTVKKKINNLRSSFRKEIKRIEKSRLSGASADDVYKPSLWYYDKLLFITDHEESIQGRSNEDSDFDEANDTEEEKSSITIKYEQDSSPEEFGSTASSIRSPSAFSLTSTRVKKEKLDETERNEELLEKNYLQFDKAEDEFDTTGKYIGNKLRHLSQDQRIFAEKIIMDVLYEAQLGALHCGSKLSAK